MSSGPRNSSEPTCPFCGTALERPKMMDLNPAESALGGSCKTCGAIFIVDPTSKNVGEVMMQVLGLAAEKLSKDLSEMVAGEDFDDAVLSYDVRTHRSTGISKSFMDGYGRLYILKVKKQQG